MSFFRLVSVLLPGILLSACSSGGSAPPPAPLQPVTAEEEPAPPPEPEPSLQDRWRSPFGVVSRGRPVAREPRRVVVLGQSSGTSTSPAPAAPAEAKPAGSSASAPAAAAPRAAPGGSTPAATSPPATASRPAAAPARPTETRGERTHKVEWGETWYGIARRYRVSASALSAANPGLDAEKLRSGQVLRIPSGAAAAPGRRTHTVEAGETLWGIARRYGVTAEQVRRANDLKDDRVRLGQTLIIPNTEQSR